MKITLLPEQNKFLFEYDGVEQEVLFSDVLESKAWANDKLITIVHKAVNDKGKYAVSTLNREVFLETMKEGDEEYHRDRGAWEINTAIHKLYALLDGKTERSAQAEIENISTVHNSIRSQLLDWNNERAEKVYALQQSLAVSESESEVAKLEKKIDKLKREMPPTSVPHELKKMYYAARDKSRPEITLANVTPEKVKESYGNSIIIA